MRDLSILKGYQREINLQTRVIKSKKRYSRKDKHKNKVMKNEDTI